MILSIIKQDQNSGHPLAIEIMYELYDHCMPECFKDILWCQKLHQGMDENRERNELGIPK